MTTWLRSIQERLVNLEAKHDATRGLLAEVLEAFSAAFYGAAMGGAVRARMPHPTNLETPWGPIETEIGRALRFDGSTYSIGIVVDVPGYDASELPIPLCIVPQGSGFDASVADYKPQSIAFQQAETFTPLVRDMGTYVAERAWMLRKTEPARS